MLYCIESDIFLNFLIRLLFFVCNYICEDNLDDIYLIDWDGENVYNIYEI